jgi:hypothetical protein
LVLQLQPLPPVLLLLERRVLQTRTTILKVKPRHHTANGSQPPAALADQPSNPMARPPTRNLQVQVVKFITPRHLSSSKVQYQTLDHQVSDPPLPLTLMQVSMPQALQLQWERPVWRPTN